MDSRRTQFLERGRAYQLRTSEVEALSDIGRFRVVDVQELARARYQDDELRMRRDLRNLAGQGLLEVRISHPKAGDRELVTLTKRGEGVLRTTGALREDQETYSGVAGLRCLNHDADLYRVYCRESARIAHDGGRPSRVVLEVELRRDLYREMAPLSGRRKKEREYSSEEIAQRHGLPVVHGRIMLPDLRIEYETREGDQARVDLELVTPEYQTSDIAAKAGTGFLIYARSQDVGRVRTALGESHWTREVFSI